MTTQKINFVYRSTPFRVGQCPVEVHRRNDDKVMVIITEPEFPGSAILSDEFEQICTQLYHRHLRSISPEQIIWIRRTHEQESNESFFQRVGLSWDGERFTFPAWQGKLNSKAFFSVFELPNTA
jgi:hypothetical protein